MHYLVTGHTGFKGAWLSALLKAKGHQVSGISLDPTSRALFKDAELMPLFGQDLRIDIRNSEKLKVGVAAVNADAVIHLAAQSLVRESYANPIYTFETNVIGTLNILEAVKSQSTKPKAVLIITTDKVYKNINKLTGYVESEELGGDDPYSASKAAADLATQSWVKSFADFPIAIARAGNVVGGGDWATDRLIPDLVSAFSKNEKPVLRFPDSIRPWQHVLDCVNGYVALIEEMLKSRAGGEWNFGPKIENDKTVGVVADSAAKYWGAEAGWSKDSAENPHEAGCLLLDSTKAREQLNWRDKLDFDITMSWTIDFYKKVCEGQNPKDLLDKQIQEFMIL